MEWASEACQNAYIERFNRTLRTEVHHSLS